MLAQVLTVKHALFLAFVAAAVYVHYRGRVRHPFLRQASDHSTLFAPYNVFMYAFSRVPQKPYLDVAQFPQLAPLAAHWRGIRDEGLALLESIPSVTGAMFAMLPPGGRLVRHRDPYAGSLRDHLGLVTPNSPDCYISVDGERYFWKDGEAVMFDETYTHFAENRTEQARLLGKRIKAKNRTVYYLLKWLLLGGLVYAILR